MKKRMVAIVLALGMATAQPFCILADPGESKSEPRTDVLSGILGENYFNGYESPWNNDYYSDNSTANIGNTTNTNINIGNTTSIGNTTNTNTNTNINIGNTTNTDTNTSIGNTTNTDTNTSIGNTTSTNTNIGNETNVGNKTNVSNETNIGNTIFNGTWERGRNASEWRLKKTDGSYAVSQWGFVDGRWYLFGNEGYTCSGWQKVDGRWYYFGEDAAMLANTITPDGYEVNENGEWIINGIVQIN